MTVKVGDRVAVRTVGGRLVDVGTLTHRGRMTLAVASEWSGHSPTFAPRPVQSWATLTHRVERIEPEP